MHDMADRLELAAKDGADPPSATAERLSASNLKRTLTDNGLSTDWYDTAGSEGEILLRQAVQAKTSGIPCGE